MRCEQCQGLGYIPSFPAELRAPNGYWLTAEDVCQTCFGSGLDYCCAGERGDCVLTDDDAARA